MDIFHYYVTHFEARKGDEYNIQECLDIRKKSSTTYTAATERMLTTIGQPRLMNAHHDPRPSRLFFNRVVKIYPVFQEFYGMEGAVEQVISFSKHTAQGLEERRQVLYLLGPPGEGKSLLIEKLRSSMEQIPVYALKGSPIYESPPGLFSPEKDGKILKEDYSIPRRYLNSIVSPWTVERLHRFNSDVTRFRVVKLHPSVLSQIVISKTESGNENNQDISSPVDKVGIRKLEDCPQDGPDACSYSDGLCLVNCRLFEFVEMFEALVKALHPLLTATREGNYKGTEDFGAIPFNGVVLVHSNGTEWRDFKSDRNNEVFLDRICTIKMSYCPRVSDETKIYDKLLHSNSLTAMPCAPNTLKMIVQFAAFTYIKKSENSSVFSEMRVYDGESLKDVDPKAESYQEYHDSAGISEGMTGLSTRFTLEVLSKVFNFDGAEVAASPVHLLYILGRQVEREQFPPGTESEPMSYIREYLTSPYVEFIDKEIQTSCLEPYSEYGQSIFDRHVVFTDLWIQDQEYRDPDTGGILDRSTLNDGLEEVGRLANTSDPKDLRDEVVNPVLRARVRSGDGNPVWTGYEKLRAAIEKQMFPTMEDLPPAISFNTKSSRDNKGKHEDFVSHMVEGGCTQKQVRSLVEWYLRTRESS